MSRVDRILLWLICLCISFLAGAVIVRYTTSVKPTPVQYIEPQLQPSSFIA